MRLIVTGLTWPQVCNLKDDYKTAKIDCGETAGALAVYSTNWDDKDAWAKEVCAIAEKHSGTVSGGQTMSELSVLNPERFKKELEALGVSVSN